MRTSDVAVNVQEGGEVLKLLADEEAECSQHGNTAVGQLCLAPALDLGRLGSGGETGGVEVRRVEGGSDSRQGGSVCTVALILVSAQYIKDFAGRTEVIR